MQIKLNFTRKVHRSSLQLVLLHPHSWSLSWSWRSPW